MKFRDIATIVVLGSSFLLYDVYTNRPRTVTPEVTYVSSRVTESVRETYQVKVHDVYKKPVEEVIEEPEETYIYTFTEAEEEILLKIAMAEAEGEGIIGKGAVMQVVINRVYSEDFPDTIEEVVFESGQFSPVTSGSYYSSVPDEQCYAALERLKKGDYVALKPLYFNPSDNSWASANRTFLYPIGNHNFYR